MYKPDAGAKPEEYAVLYVGHSDDLSTERFPFDHPAASCWLSRVDNKRFDLYIGICEAPGANARHREQIVRELVAVYKPGCNPDQYDQAWEDHWIGDYQTPGTTGPLTTGRDPSGQ
jgi:hypothetical protein